MKSNTALAWLFVLAVGGVTGLAGGWDYLWGQWESKGNPPTVVVFTPTNLTVTVNATQEVWQVVGGTNLVLGLTVSRAGTQVTAQAAVKFDEMVFSLGERQWVLKKVGSRAPDFGGELPNQPVPP